MKLDIGGGKSKGNSWETIDIHPSADIVHNLDTYPWPIRNNSCEEMLMSHILEHLKEPFKAIKECYRIAKPGAILEIRVPWWELDMFSNPFHLNWFKPRWFHILTPEINIWNDAMNHIMGKMNWKVDGEHILRGSIRFWKKYQYTVWLKAQKGMEKC